LNDDGDQRNTARDDVTDITDRSAGGPGTRSITATDNVQMLQATDVFTDHGKI